MKIIIAVVSALLVITAGGAGYFINDLNGQIDSLQTELAGVSGDLGTKLDAAGVKLDDTAARLGGEIQASSANLSAAIADAGSALTEYTATASQRFATIEGDITDTGHVIDDLAYRTGETEEAFRTSVLQAAQLYDQVKQSIVMISNGQYLIGSGFIAAGITGSGIVIPKTVVTAYHVVKDLPEIFATLDDGRTCKMLVWAKSEETDIAILRFMADDGSGGMDLSALTPLSLADSRGVKVGDPVFVLGSPGDGEESRLGLKETLTSGVISQVGRGVTVSDIYQPNLLQIDAAVNFGNSGGPLFNIDGEVIGVVTARINPEQGDGISFAVPSNQVARVGKAIVYGQTGPFTYEIPWLGVTARDMLPLEVFANNNNFTGGARVTAVTGPASLGGVRVNDVIKKMDDRVINDSDEFFAVLAEYYSPGDSITLEIYRDGSLVHVTVDVRKKP
ncbi:MAG: trypsin-like peptidase domain-containing protein [Dehalococcoidales bacterium]